MSDNEMIAIFIGDEKIHPSKRKYENDWDWLIPVCQKAKDVHYNIANGPRLYREIELALLTLNIRKVYNACLKFINNALILAY